MIGHVQAFRGVGAGFSAIAARILLGSFASTSARERETNSRAAACGSALAS